MSTTTSEPVSISLKTLNECTTQGSQEKLEAAMKKVADVEPLEDDRF